MMSWASISNIRGLYTEIARWVARALAGLDLPPQWTQLRALGTNRVLKSSYFWLLFVPLVAKFTQQLAQPLHVPLFGQVHMIRLDLPFSWLAFYFASICFALGSGIFAWRCPAVIKEFENFSEFHLRGNGAYVLINFIGQLPKADNRDCIRQLRTVSRNMHIPDKVLRIQLEKRFPATDPLALGSIDESEFGQRVMTLEYRSEIIERMAAFPRADLSDLFQVVRNHSDGIGAIWRLLVSLCYAAGFGFTINIAWQSFCTVWTIALGKNPTTAWMGWL